MRRAESRTNRQPAYATNELQFPICYSYNMIALMRVSSCLFSWQQDAELLSLYIT